MAEFLLELENLNSNSGLTIDDASLAISLSLFNSGADYNGDGIDDLVVSSAPAGSTNQELQIIYGGDDLPADLDLGDADSTTLVTGDADSSFSIVLFASNLDFNGDRIDDLIYTGLEQSTEEQPNFVSRLVFGSEDLPTTIDLSDLDGSNGLEFTGEQSIFLAQGININGDASDDLIFSAGDSSEAEPTLESYIFFGDDRDFSPTLNPTAVSGGNGSAIDGDDFSLVLGARQDINNDGIDDLAINSFSLDAVEGSSSSILFGSETLPASIDVNTFDGDDGFNIISDGADDEITTAFLIEDTNDDAIGDILVSQTILEESEDAELEELDPSDINNIANLQNISERRLFMVFGSETFDETINLADLDGDNGFEIVNSANDELNMISSNTLDINNDGLQDMVINDVIGDRTYVVFGKSEFAAEIDLADLDGDDGFVLAEASFSYTNSYTGDINGDSLDDLILETDGDRTYVVFGTEDDFGAEFDPTEGDANALVIFAQDTDLAITNIIDLNGDGADDLIYESILSVASVFEPAEVESDIPDIQVVYGDSDLGTSS